MDDINTISEKILGCAIKVHTKPGPGLLENIYHKALCIELTNSGLMFESEKPIDIKYENQLIGQFRLDILVENKIVVELKSVERYDPLFEAQLLSYMKLGGYKLGLLINFNNKLLKQGIKRLIL
jgi:GxxExxY protein